MPAAKQLQAQSVNLSEQDRIRLHALSVEMHKTKGEIGRDAIRFYLEHHETAGKVEHDDKLAKVMLKCTDRIIGVMANSTNRICSLLVRNAIDTNITMMLFYRMLPDDQADAIMARMYRMGVSRLTRKLSPDELNLTKIIKEGMEQPLIDVLTAAATTGASR